MQKNFTIDQQVYLVSKGRYYDLHNNYRLHQFNIFPTKAIVSLIWLKLNRDWIMKEEPSEIVINFAMVSSFEITKNLITNRVGTVQEIGYKDPDDTDMDWLESEKNFKAINHIIFRFENDECVRICAEFAELKHN